MNKLKNPYEEQIEQIEQINLNRINLEVSLLEESGKFSEERRKFAKEELILRMKYCIYGEVEREINEEKHIHEKWPEDWWQAFKERWFPKFLLKKFPIKYKFIDYDISIHEKLFKSVCPHIHIDEDKLHKDYLCDPVITMHKIKKRSFPIWDNFE